MTPPTRKERGRCDPTLRWLPLLLCSCNQVFGLAETVAVDAAYFDAPPDAPAACPVIGGEPPRFSRIAHQIVQHCVDFTTNVAGTRATATCLEPTFGISDGPADGPFVAVASLAPAGRIHFDEPRLAPDGDDVFVRRWDDVSNVGSIVAYRRQSDDSFALAYAVDLAGRTFTSSIVHGTPTFGPPRRMFVQPRGQDPLEEIEIDATGNATTLERYTFSELGVTFNLSVPNLSSDGKRIVFLAVVAGETSVMYSDRASMTERFRPAVPMPTVPDVNDAFLTDDCARMYFAALQTVIWVQAL